MTGKKKIIKELKEALDSLDITNKYRLNLIRAIEYLQEEPVSSIWHDASEEPKEGYTIVVYMNDDSLKVLTSWDENGDFCIGDGFWYNIHQQKSWAYKDDLLDKKEEPVNSNEHELSLIAIEALDKKRLRPDLKGVALHKFNNEWNTIKQVICWRSIGEIKLNYRLALHWASWGAQNLKNYFGMSDEEKAKMDIPKEPVSEDLEKASIEFAKNFGDWQYALPCFKAGAQWQKKQGITENAEINYWIQRGLSIRLEDKCLDDLGFEEGDKVKIVIIKED